MFSPLRCPGLRPQVVPLSIKQASSTVECDYYRYTAGRWLFNETQQLKARYVQFNINALTAAAAKSVGQEESSCIKVEKLPEGNFNKSLLITMANGSQVIARVPNPNAGAPHYTTASEVATMDFARTKLGIPVPKVLSWSSHALNPVGAEYIIMDKASGCSLAQVWPRLKNDEKRDIVQAIVSFDVKIRNSPLGGFGSLYYPRDIPSEIKHLPAFKSKDCGRWVLGPTTDRRFFDDGKGELSIDRGPWSTTQEYIVATCHREMKAIQSMPLQPEGIVGPNGYQPDRALKLSVCRDFLKIADYILPPEAYQLPVLWHKDLHLDNIFVNPEKPTDIVGLIDWQNSHIAPLFDQATHPAFLDYNGPRLEGLTVPSLPENFEELNGDAKKRAKELLVAQTLYKYYDLFSASMNVPVYQALRYQETLQGEIISLVGMLLNDGEPAVQGLLIKLASRWNQLRVPCPLEYSPEAIQHHQALEEKWAEGMALMDDVLESLGGAIRGWDGWVSHEEYEPLKKKCALVKQQFIEHFAGNDKKTAEAWEMAWPFQ
ncbi:Phosphotransferase enzyme [Microsporum ferrugineum]